MDHPDHPDPAASPKRPWVLALGATLVGLGAAFAVPASWVFLPDPVHDEAADEGVRFACVMGCVMLDEIPADPRCPVCGMELGPVGSEARLDASERAMVGLVPARVEHAHLVRELRLYGELTWAEDGIVVQSARADGFVEALVERRDFEEVEEGDPLLELYSPEIYSAMADWKAASSLDASSEQAARRRLSLLGLDGLHLAALRSSETIPRRVEVRAPGDGVIIRRRIEEGAAVRRGEELFAIADPTRVWLELQLLPGELDGVLLDTPIDLQLPGGEAYRGEISFVDPIVGSPSRITRARIELRNRRGEDGRWTLMPGQRIASVARIPLDSRGRPTRADNEPQDALSVPRSAVLATGKRSIVYVLFEAITLPDGRRRRNFELDPERLPASLAYEAVEVVLGPLARRDDSEALDEVYPVLRVARRRQGPTSPWESGPIDEIRAGMWVAREGALLLDSQAQLSGSPSLLQPEGSVPPTGDAGAHAGH